MAAMIPDTPTQQAHRQQSTTTSHSQIASEVVSPELGNSHSATPSVSPSPSPSPSYQSIQSPSDQGYGEQGIEDELENIMNGIDVENLVYSLQRFMPLASLSANKVRLPRDRACEIVAPDASSATCAPEVSPANSHSVQPSAPITQKLPCLLGLEFCVNLLILDSSCLI